MLSHRTSSSSSLSLPQSHPTRTYNTANLFLSLFLSFPKKDTLEKSRFVDGQNHAVKCFNKKKNNIAEQEMDTDRPPHRSTSNGISTSTSTGELFICFTSRLSSSSSMKVSSKSILSPGRARDSSQISLSTSLSRRLRSSGSIKGGQASPMFPSINGKKRGCSFENPEPSSPKVTCIGQVRVKTKKQGKKIRARSTSRREVGFRRTEQLTSINSSSSTNSHNLDAKHFQDYGHMGHQFQQQECFPHRNQRWVQLPVTICEALRAFGAEFNCFLPCRSSCMANNDHKEKEGKANARSNVTADGNASSCGAMFARWITAEKIELVAGEKDREEEDDMPRRSQRRHVFEDIVIEGDKCEQKNEILEEKEAMVSICVPPKNALLLMRCRSDPVKMAALANRFWECPPPQDEAENENEEHEEEHGGEDSQQDEQTKIEQEMEQKQDVSSDKLASHQIIEEHKNPDAEVEEEKEESVLHRVEEDQESQDFNEAEDAELQKQVQEEKQVMNLPVLEEEEETVPSDSSAEARADPDDEESVAKVLLENGDAIKEKSELVQEVENTEAFADIEEKRPSLSSSSDVLLQPEQESQEDKQGQENMVAADSVEEEETTEKKEEETETAHERYETGDPEMTLEPEIGQESKGEESEKQHNLLPDCLLLMMCEPKLSMEVSKETWVCSTDFIRWQPPEKKPPLQTVDKKDVRDDPDKRVSNDTNPAQQHQLLMQPPRSSCSFPAAPPLPPALGAPSMKTMNTMIDQKLVAARPRFEPFELTRCMSEPRKSSAKLAPETCFWKNRKIEPHCPATVGVGAAGVGF